MSRLIPFTLGLFLCCISASLEAQGNLRFGPELGIVLSRFPDHKSWTFLTDQKQESFIPVAGPRIGLHAEMALSPKWTLSSGLYYDRYGIRYEYSTAGRNPRDPSLPMQYSFVNTQTEQLMIHRGAIPLTLSYSPGGKKLRASLFAGYSQHYLITGTHSYLSVKDASDNSRDQRSENSFNPVSTSLPRFNGQFTAGTSLMIVDKVKLMLACSIGSSRNYSGGTEKSWRATHGNYQNADWSLSLCWLFGRKAGAANVH